MSPQTFARDELQTERMQTWDGTTPLPPRSTPIPLPLTVSTRFSHDHWVAELTLMTHQDDSSDSGYILWTYTEPHDVANGSTDLTEQVRDRAIGQFANRFARLLASAPTAATHE